MKLRWEYKGKELLPFARIKYEEYKTKENHARNRMAVMIKDPVTFHDDRDLQQVKSDIDRLSAVREQLEVYCLEFKRRPEKGFSLHMSDMVFFGIHLAHNFKNLPDIQKSWHRVEELDRQKRLCEEEINETIKKQQRLLPVMEVLRVEGEEGELRMQIVDTLRTVQTQLSDCEVRLKSIKQERQKLQEQTIETTINMKMPVFEIPEQGGK